MFPFEKVYPENNDNANVIPENKVGILAPIITFRIEWRNMFEKRKKKGNTPGNRSYSALYSKLSYYLLTFLNMQFIDKCEKANCFKDNPVLMSSLQCIKKLIVSANSDNKMGKLFEKAQSKELENFFIDYEKNKVYDFSKEHETILSYLYDVDFFYKKKDSKEDGEKTNATPVDELIEAYKKGNTPKKKINTCSSFQKESLFFRGIPSTSNEEIKNENIETLTPDEENVDFITHFKNNTLESFQTESLFFKRGIPSTSDEEIENENIETFTPDEENVDVITHVMNNTLESKRSSSLFNKVNPFINLIVNIGCLAFLSFYIIREFYILPKEV